MEVYDRAFDNDQVAPSGVPLFVAFIVDDLEGAHRELESTGVEVSDIVWAAKVFDNPGLEGLGSFFFHAPDGNVYVIESDPR